MCGSVEFGAWLNMNWRTGSAGPLYSDRGHTAQMLVYTRMGVSSLKNSVSATDNWFLNSITFICNRISKLCNIEIQEEKVT